MSAHIDLTVKLCDMSFDALDSDGWTEDAAYDAGREYFQDNLRRWKDPSYDAVPDEIPERFADAWENGWKDAAYEHRQRADEFRHPDVRIF